MIENLDYIPNVIRSEELSDLSVDQKLAEKVAELMTPANILEKLEFDRPEVIIPDEIPDFETLYFEREKVRTLRLLPIKDEEGYRYYHQQSRESLLAKIMDNLGSSPMMLAVNAYPYLLPEDVGQYLVWVKNREIPNDNVINFITRCVQCLRLSLNDIILFERPPQTHSKLVKGSFGELRHIHFWMRMKEETK